MANCPHGFSDRAWCNKCSIEERMVNKPTRPDGTEGVSVSQIARHVNSAGEFVRRRTYVHLDRPNESVRIIVKLANGSRYGAYTFNKFGGNQCAGCGTELVKNELVIKTIKMLGDGKAHWVCADCWTTLEKGDVAIQLTSNSHGVVDH